MNLATNDVQALISHLTGWERVARELGLKVPEEIL